MTPSPWWAVLLVLGLLPLTASCTRAGFRPRQGEAGSPVGADGSSLDRPLQGEGPTRSGDGVATRGDGSLCHTWSEWSCSGLLGCDATCSSDQTTTLTIHCTGLGVAFCDCRMGSSVVGTCPSAGAGCSLCEMVFDCCQKNFP